MKYIIASDIHGSAHFCRLLLEAFDVENADRLILLGDILYHGPRNSLPDGYDTKSVAQMLNAYKDKLFAVRGNCDTEVDQMMLEFPILADYAVLSYENNVIYLSHGHKFNYGSPLLANGNIIICGHTHIPACENKDGVIYLNPGSVSIPKENSYNGYMIFENGVFIWKDLYNNTKKVLELES